MTTVMNQLRIFQSLRICSFNIQINHIWVEKNKLITLGYNNPFLAILGEGSRPLCVHMCHNGQSTGQVLQWSKPGDPQWQAFHGGT